MRTDERGDTLLEVIIAVAILGIVLVAFAGGLVTIVHMSDVHRKQASASAYLRDFAEAVKSSIAEGNYIECDNPSYYETVFVLPDDRYTKRVTDSNCAVYGSEVQRLTLEVASTDNRARERLVIFVRKPCSATQC